MKVSNISEGNELDATGVFGCIVRLMKLNFLAVLAGAAMLATGCVNTVTDQRAFASTWSKDTISARYPRTTEQVYHAAQVVVQQDGTLTREFITPGTNVVRSLQGKINQRDVWIRVTEVTPQLTQLDVQARGDWGGSDVDLAAQLNTEIALQLQQAR
jgi:hypothetical protein